MPDLIAAINIHIDPVLLRSGGFELTWHGFFTAVGIALGVWLAIRLARRVGLNEDDAMSIALVAVPAGIVGARLLWVLEHTDQIDSVGDIFAITDGGISVYGGMIGGVIGGFTYATFFKKEFPRWVALDVAAPGMILGQAVGRFGDFINGEHFAKVTDLPWAFKYTHPNTDGPWANLVEGEHLRPWARGQFGGFNEQPVPVHPVAGVYEPILDFAVLGVLLLMWRRRVLPGWGFVVYVLGYAVIRGLLSILRADEATPFGGDLATPQFIAIVTGIAAAVMAYYLWRHPQRPARDLIAERAARREGGGRGGGTRAERRRTLRRKGRGIYGR